MKKTKIDVEVLIDIYKQTNSMQEVASQLNCSVGFVYNTLKKSGVYTSLKGRKLKKEHREKVVKTLQHGANKGHKHSLETLQKMKENRKGSKNPNWRGGRTKIVRKLRRTADYVNWVNAVKLNAGNKCEQCGSEKNLHAHHIKGIWEAPEKIFDLKNGKCLCEKCHKEIHKCEKLV